MSSIVTTRAHICVVCGSRESDLVATGTDYQYKTTAQLFKWYCCKGCKHFFINPIPDENSLNIIYPSTLKNYEDFDIHPSIAFKVKSWLDGIQLRRLALRAGEDGRLLDVGCAAGMLLDIARLHCPNLKTLHGLEISEEASISAVRKGYFVYHSTIENTNLPANFYDIIFMQQVIEHVHNPRAVLEKLRQSLRHGGCLVIETPNLGSWDQSFFNSGYWEGYHIPRHFNLWTIEGMKKMINEAGFSDFSYRKRIKPVHWTLSLQNWAINTKKPSWVVKFFDLRNLFLLIVFGLVDFFQLILFDKASDIQYLATK